MVLQSLVSRETVWLTAIILFIAQVSNAAVSIVDHDSDTGLKIISLNEVRTVNGRSSKMTVAGNALSMNGAVESTLNVEAETRGFFVKSWCVNFTNATAAAAVHVNFNRRLTVSSTGTTAANEQVTALSASSASFDWQRDGATLGVTRTGTVTEGTAGPLLDTQSFQIGEVGAAEFNGKRVCRSYGRDSGKMPYVPPGTSRGVSLTLSVSGAGGRSVISMEMITIWVLPKE